MFSLLLNSISLLISFVLPLITTYKALNSNNQHLLKPWIIYWIVYSLLITLEHHLYFVLKYIPFYSFGKIYLSVWLILPQTQGSLFIYDHYLNPFLSSYEVDFDQFVNKVSEKPPIGFLFSIFKGGEQGNNNDGDEQLLNKSYFDVFAQSFYQSSTKNDSIPQSNNIFQSLFGVLESMNTNTSKDASTTTTTPNTTTSLSNDNDFDVVGKEEYENIRTSESNNYKNTSWFGYLWGKPKEETFKTK